MKSNHVVNHAGKSSTKTVPVCLDGELLKAVEKRAKETKSTAGEVVAQSCRQFLGNENGGHVITLELGEFAYTALRLYALDCGIESPEEAALDAVRSHVSTLMEIPEKNFNAKFLEDEEYEEEDLQTRIERVRLA